MVQAFILIQTEVGKSRAVSQAVGSLDGVVEATDVTGPYDVIARCEAGTMDELGTSVISRIQEVSGITRTLTCTAVQL